MARPALAFVWCPNPPTGYLVTPPAGVRDTGFGPRDVYAPAGYNALFNEVSDWIGYLGDLSPATDVLNVGRIVGIGDPVTAGRGLTITSGDDIVIEAVGAGKDIILSAVGDFVDVTGGNLRTSNVYFALDGISAEEKSSTKIVYGYRAIGGRDIVVSAGPDAQAWMVNLDGSPADATERPSISSDGIFVGFYNRDASSQDIIAWGAVPGIQGVPSDGTTVVYQFKRLDVTFMRGNQTPRGTVSIEYKVKGDLGTWATVPGFSIQCPAGAGGSVTNNTVAPGNVNIDGSANDYRVVLKQSSINSLAVTDRIASVRITINKIAVE